ncbi:hypothetical protein Poli38472_004778 [Pythium oligandrum]|uniref:Transmembrane protein n=1 Tax=Pythium oligandrum TaxID=41045 RepID=A0A8K1CAE8_PYTOL|nr:hypothetical protein Poli38472_004778 [Pythium oligandrum]|eukprot:TMW59709.1 hypothetical protein Poli38472_004778 [Pythium oligandrum]
MFGSGLLAKLLGKRAHSRPATPANVPLEVSKVTKVTKIKSPPRSATMDASDRGSSNHSVGSYTRNAVAGLARTAVSNNGMICTVIYVIFATLLAISAYGLQSIANRPIKLGVVELTWFRETFDISVNTFMQGKTTMQAIAAANSTDSHGTRSLADLQYDTCGKRDWTCADKVRPNTEQVLYLLADAFHTIPQFELPELAKRSSELTVQYVNQLTGYNFPVVQYSLAGVETDPTWAVTCIFRRTRYRVAQEEADEIDSIAICSKRRYDPDWICENGAEKNVTSYIVKIKHGQVKYLGQTPRGELYYNPGNVATLRGSAQGTGFLSTVIGIDEYNGGVLQSSAPWDIAAAYLCKGTFNFDTYVGMRWQGQGLVNMTWTSGSLLLTNSLVLWAITMSLALLQFLYLPRSSVCVLPVEVAKSLVGPVILGFACYGNYHVQVLTTHLQLSKVSGFNSTPLKLCGPVMFASVIGIMSGTAIQSVFNPLLVAPSYVLTIVSVVNWFVVFALEAYVVIATGIVMVGIVVVFMIRRRQSTKVVVSNMNSVLRLFSVSSLDDLATSGAGGCVVIGSQGIPVVDAGVLLNKNLIRVSSTSIVRVGMVKYVFLWRLLPPFLSRLVSHVVGLTLVIKSSQDRVVKELVFFELKDMKLHTVKQLPAYYS